MSFSEFDSDEIPCHSETDKKQIKHWRDAESTLSQLTSSEYGFSSSASNRNDSSVEQAEQTLYEKPQLPKVINRPKVIGGSHAHDDSFYELENTKDFRSESRPKKMWKKCKEKERATRILMHNVLSSDSSFSRYNFSKSGLEFSKIQRKKFKSLSKVKRVETETLQNYQGLETDKALEYIGAIDQDYQWNIVTDSGKGEDASDILETLEHHVSYLVQIVYEILEYRHEHPMPMPDKLCQFILNHNVTSLIQKIRKMIASLYRYQGLFRDAHRVEHALDSEEVALRDLFPFTMEIERFINLFKSQPIGFETWNLFWDYHVLFLHINDEVDDFVSSLTYLLGCM